ncbi:methylenetetrahydrofolate reductase [Nonomuraea sp. KC401]|uniref:methylenetetrahydrofolate reductase n=1 Tax=unclassified Nonomuraea TaxID=2593643 RepID=UPI0010FEABF4|nr:MULTISPECIES: methylenetetrahydrofolate reductase [unclassified Nonomuraea]NBE91769.1 methylenetetrahydrofolate reductase [Nonomuraea sp. K271]TLF86372.1 methylenetetrahydrofolate reductase [Nonomuraea sp. KC401]
MSGLRAAFEAGRFAVTAEIGPPGGADAEAVTRKAELLQGWVDAANVTDNQGANVRMSSLAGSVLAQRAGVEPVMQLTCRDRNRMALQSDLLAAGALGIPNVLLLTGDHPRFGDHPEAKPVFDLDGVQLVWTARTLRDDGVLLSGKAVPARPAWLIGTVENPFAPPPRFRARRLAKKVSAGAEFVQTQYVFDFEVFERWMADLRELGVTDHCKVIAGVGPIRSLRALDYMRTAVPGVHVPDEVDRRLRGVPAGRVAEEGIRMCVEAVQRLATIPGVAGVHLMALGFEHGVPDILRRAGIPRPPAALPDHHRHPMEGIGHAR